MLGLTAGWKLVFVVRPTDRMSVAQGLFRWVLAQDRSPDTPGGFKSALRPVGIPLKRVSFRRQVINLAAPRKVRALVDGSLRIEDVGLGKPDINACLPEFMSDDLDRLQMDLWADQHCLPKCAPAFLSENNIGLAFMVKEVFYNVSVGHTNVIEVEQCS